MLFEDYPWYKMGHHVGILLISTLFLIIMLSHWYKIAMNQFILLQFILLHCSTDDIQSLAENVNTSQNNSQNILKQSQASALHSGSSQLPQNKTLANRFVPSRVRQNNATISAAIHTPITGRPIWKAIEWNKWKLSQ